MKAKVADRILVVTTSAIIKLDNKFKVMKTIPLEKVSVIEQQSLLILRITRVFYTWGFFMHATVFLLDVFKFKSPYAIKGALLLFLFLLKSKKEY